MADQKITALTELNEADVASTDVLPIADVSASETKKVTVKSLVEQGVDLIDDASIPAAKLASISPSSLGSSSGAKEFIAGPTGAGGAYSSRVIASTDLPAATASALGGAAAGTGLTSSSGTFSVDAATASARGAISVPSASGLSVDGSGVISHQSSVTGQTKNGFTVNDSGHITAVGSIAAGDLPKATTSAVGGIFVGSGLSVTGSGQLNHTDSITAGTTSGITFNAQGHITATTALAASDLPAGTTSAKGGVSVPSGALSVSGAGALTHDNSGVTAGTYPKVTVDARGHVTAGTTLSASDIPDISAAKLTSGTIGTSLIANDAVTGGKLANGSSVRFAGAPDTNGVVDFGTADFNGQFLYDAFNENLYLYDGNAFKSIDIVSGEIVFAGTYNANTNTVASVTAKGTAIGLTVGQALIAPASSNLNHYLTVSVSGTGSGNAPAEALAPPDFLLSTGTSWQVLDLSTALAATAANNVSFSPTGNVAASNVQAAIEELDTEKLAANNPNMTGTATFAGNVVLGTASSLVFEGSSADDYETTFSITNPTADRTIVFGDSSGTVILTGDTGTVTNAMLAGSIALTKLANLTSGQLIVGNSSNVPTAVALSGDATISNSGALTIANDAVTAAKLADTSVTAGSYTAADITVDAQGRITAAASGTIGTSEIANDAVTADKLADTSVTAGSYTAADITVDAQGRITSAASGTIGTSEIANDAVTADKLADTSVTAGSYTLSSITVDAQGRITAASSGTAADADKITEGNTEAEVVDTGSDGHFKVTTENTERIRVGPAGQIGIAGANYGTSGQVLTSGGASGAVSWADAAAGGSTYAATASGAIANGDPCIVNSSGNIEAVKKNASALTNASVGTETQLVRGATGTDNKFMFMDSIYVESFNKIVIVYSESGAGIYARVGSFDGDGNFTVTSEQQIHSKSSAEEPRVTYHPTQNKFLCVWNNDDGLSGRSFILTGTTISFDASATTIHSSTSGVRDIGAAYDSNADRTLVAYGLKTGSEIGKAVVVQVNSDGSLSQGTPETVESDACFAFQGTVYDPDAQKLAIFYNNNGTTKGRVATIDTSDNSVDLGTSETIVSAGSSHFAAAHDPVNDKILAAYQNSTDNKGYLVVATITGTDIDFGTPVEFEAGQANYNDISYDSTGDKFLVVNGDGGNGDRGAAISATISGTTPIITTASQLDATGGQQYHSTVFANDVDKHYVFYSKESNRDLELNIVTTTTTNPNLTTENFIGISDAAYADTATATVQIVGSVDDAQSGLTPGKKHYVKKDGSLTTSTVQLPLVEAGTAVAATKIIVKG